MADAARSAVPVLIGYFPKRTMQRPDWLKAARVEEVCSVSTCMSAAPDGWIDAWRHNEMWVFDTPELAWSITAPSVRDEFDLYAYKLFPLKFDRGTRQSFEIPLLDVQPLPASFERLGYDVVSRCSDAAFECSPLSCNQMAQHVPVTRHCLLEDSEAAFRLAAECEVIGCEPGPYYVVEVWRQARGSRP